MIMKTLGLLRNLMSKSTDIDNIMSEHSKQLMNAVSELFNTESRAKTNIENSKDSVFEPDETFIMGIYFSFVR